MRVNPLIIFREDFENSAVLFNPEDGKILGLNRTGAFIWRSLAEGKDTPEIVAALTEACSGNVPETIANDVENYLARLKERGLVID